MLVHISDLNSSNSVDAARDVYYLLLFSSSKGRARERKTDTGAADDSTWVFVVLSVILEVLIHRSLYSVCKHVWSVTNSTMAPQLCSSWALMQTDSSFCRLIKILPIMTCYLYLSCVISISLSPFQRCLSLTPFFFNDISLLVKRTCI